jgi:hypothetical protein
MLNERPKVVDKDSRRLQKSETMLDPDEMITAYTEIINAHMQRAQISPICAACADSDDISKADQIGRI